MLPQGINKRIMKQQSYFSQHNLISSQRGSLATACWFTINSSKNDRTPEGYDSSGFEEGAGYA
jgi:hypothetical protein